MPERRSCVFTHCYRITCHLHILRSRKSGHHCHGRERCAYQYYCEVFLCSCSYLLPIHKSTNKSFIGNIITIDSENINNKAITIVLQICFLYDKPRSTVISASFSTILLFQKSLYLITLPILHLAEKFLCGRLEALLLPAVTGRVELVAGIFMFGESQLSHPNIA